MERESELAGVTQQQVPGPTADNSNHSAAPVATGSRWLADACLLLTACMWGINIPVVKDAISNLDPFLFNALRLIFSVLALGTLVWLEGLFGERMPWRVPWRQVLVFAGLAGFVYQIIFMLAITRTTAGNTALILSTMPMWTAILSFLFYHERLPRVTWLGFAITFSGTIVVISSGGKLSYSAEHLYGNLFMLAAAMAWAGATVYSRPLMQTISPLRLSFVSSVVTTPIHLLLLPLMMQFATKEYPDWQTKLLEWQIVLAILFSGAFSTGLAYATWNIGVQLVGGSHAAVYQNVVTLVAVLGGWLVLGEQILSAQIVGGILIIAGLLVMRRGRRV